MSDHDMIGNLSATPPTVKSTLAWVTVYAVAMGVLEAAVVVYLRRLYFPEGFRFPLSIAHNDVAVVELWRELATLLMLVAIGVLAGRNRGERFAYFLFSFGVWDLVYYGFLKLALDWPDSWFTWDILFLLPVPWVGPVIAPCIVALSMVVLALVMLRSSSRGADVRPNKIERNLLLAGALVVIASFTFDWIRSDGPTLWRNIVSDRALIDGLDRYVPREYPWAIFFVGEGMILVGIAAFGRRMRRFAPRHVVAKST